MALELTDLARETVPGDTMKPLPTDITVGGTTVATCKPAVLTLQMLKRLDNILRGEGERERERERELIIYDIAAAYQSTPILHQLSLSTSLKSLFIV